MLPTRIVYEHRVKLPERSRAIADSLAKIDCRAQNIERRRSVKWQGGDSFKPRNHRSQENDPIVGVDAERLEGDAPSWLCIIVGWSGSGPDRDLGSRARPECWVNHHKLPGREGEQMSLRRTSHCRAGSNGSNGSRDKRARQLRSHARLSEHVVRESSVRQVEDGYLPIGVAWKRIAAASVVQIGEAQFVGVLAPGGNR